MESWKLDRLSELTAVSRTRELTEAEKADIVRKSALAKKIRDIDLMDLTPSGAIRVLEELKKEI